MEQSLAPTGLVRCGHPADASLNVNRPPPPFSHAQPVILTTTIYPIGKLLSFYFSLFLSLSLAAAALPIPPRPFLSVGRGPRKYASARLLPKKGLVIAWVVLYPCERKTAGYLGATRQSGNFVTFFCFCLALFSYPPLPLPSSKNKSTFFFLASLFLGTRQRTTVETFSGAWTAT